jgi:hypothetical protein
VTRPFWKAPRELAALLTTRVLSPSEFTLLVFLGVSGADREHGLATTNGYLATALDVNERTVRRGLRALRARGFIEYDDHQGIAGFAIRVLGPTSDIRPPSNVRSVSEVTSDTAAPATGLNRSSEAGLAAVTTSDTSRARAETETETENELLRSSRTASTELAVRSDDERPPAQALVGLYVDLMRALPVEPPARVKGQVARRVADLLGEGYAVDVIAGALGLLVKRRLHPSALDSLIIEAVAGPGRPNEHAADALARRLRGQRR